MKKFVLIFTALLCTSAWADLEALRQAELEGQRQERAAAQKAQAKAAAQAKARQEAARQKEQQIAEQKKRDREYEELKREIEIEDMRTELEEKKALRKARTSRAENFTEAQLSQMEAITDNIKANSEATRAGIKDKNK